jgi:flagellar FliL protein
MKWIVIAVSAVVLLAGGFLAWRYLGAGPASAHVSKDASNAEESSADEKPDKGEKGERGSHANENGVINLEPFLVNLADKDNYRYLRITMRVVITTRSRAEQITTTETTLSKVRDAVLGILSSKTSDEIVTSPGKLQLKSDIKDNLNSFLPDKPVMDIYFTDFVVQL